MRRTVKGAALTGALMLASFGIAVRTPAQISPGPLSEAHRSLDESDRCFDCHGPGRDHGAITERCLDCHREIRTSRDRGAGYHGRDARGACVTCHPEHGGRAFELIEWPGGSVEAFDHDRAGWRLEGRHRNTKCRECHRADRVREAPATREGKRDDSRTFLGLDPSCIACHTDPHRGKLGATCTDCHAFTGWRPARNFDHARTAFPLEGKHVEVECTKCHPAATVDDSPETTRVWKPIAHADCTPCHADAHAGRFAGACAACHVTAGFRIVAEDRFDHAHTGWALTGKHRTLPCAECHDPVDAWGKRPARDRCSVCHRDAHAGTATLRGAVADCASCHDTTAFRPSTYDVVDHDSAPYVLAGKHRTVECARCHRPPGDTAIVARPDPAGVTLRPASSRCVDCHDDTHGGQLAERDDGGECASCHTVDGWLPSTYGAEQHASTRLPLEGRHAATPCRDCHAAERPRLPPLGPDVARGKAGVALTTLDPSCAACHQDPHGEALRGATGASGGDTVECGTCHTTASFRPARVDADTHARFDYPLEGAHRVVPCAACHRELAQGERASSAGSPEQRTFRVAHGRCVDCHESPHLGSMSPDNEQAPCDRCHDVRSFRPAARFDHDRDTSFSLRGAHRGVPCRSCHPVVGGADGLERVQYHPTATRCRDCHANERAGPATRGSQGSSER